MVRLAKGDWAVVCDGRKALFLVNAGSAVAPELKVHEEMETDNPPTGEQGTDAPGRSYQSANARRSAVGQTDWHDQAERDFLEGVAVRLDRAVADGETGKIVLVAPPRALGMIRTAMTPAVKSAVVVELAKDYVMMPVSEITRLIAEQLD
jgi:protein required for attachment to host cells